MKNIEKSITINMAVNTYIEWKAQTIVSAYSRYKPNLMKLCGFLKENILLKDLTGDHLIAFHRSMAKQGLSNATVALSMRIIKNFVQFWHGRKAIDINPKEVIPPRVLTPEQPVVEISDVRQMSILLDENMIGELQKKLVIHMLWDTGMRVSEVVSMDLANLQRDENGKLRIAKIRTRKTNRYNLVLWSEQTEGLLTKYLGWRLSQNHPSDDFLFIRTDKRSMGKVSTRTIERWVKKLAKQAMIGKQIHPHSFRHGKAIHILDSGGSAIDVQTILRHQNLNSSLNYMRLNKTKYVQRAQRFLEGVTIPSKRSPLKKTDYSNEFVHNTNLVYNTG